MDKERLAEIEGYIELGKDVGWTHMHPLIDEYADMVTTLRQAWAVNAVLRSQLEQAQAAVQVLRNATRAALLNVRSTRPVIP